MNVVNYYPLAVATTTTGTANVFVGNSEVLQLYVPGFTTVFNGATIEFRLRGVYATGTSAGASALTASYYDYVNKTPAECVITVTAAGLYEIPNAGGPPIVNIQYSSQATNATTIYLLASKTTY